MTRAAGKLPPFPQPDTPRSYADETLYGQCENADCARHARATCRSCGGEYCHWHTRHPEHQHSASRS